MSMGKTFVKPARKQNFSLAVSESKAFWVIFFKSSTEMTLLVNNLVWKNEYYANNMILSRSEIINTNFDSETAQPFIVINKIFGHK